MIKANDVLIKSKQQRSRLLELDQRLSFELGLLLKIAQPTRERIHQLTRIMQRELETDDFEETRVKVHRFFQIPFDRRTTGQFLKTFGIRAYPWLTEQFFLKFTHAQISDTRLAKLAKSIGFFLKLAISPPKPLVDTDFLHLTLHKLVHPKGPQKTSGLRLIDFVYVWRRVARGKWSDQYDPFFKEILKDINFDYATPKLSNPPISSGTIESDPGHEIKLTQTDLDWMRSILIAINKGLAPPRYPLARGPNQPATRNLEKVVRTMNLIKREGVVKGLLANTAKSICTRHLAMFGQKAA